MPLRIDWRIGERRNVVEARSESFYTTLINESWPLLEIDSSSTNGNFLWRGSNGEDWATLLVSAYMTSTWYSCDCTVRECTLHFRTPYSRSENSKLKMTERPQIQLKHIYYSFISIHYKINLPRETGEFKHIYYSFISIHYKINLPRETDAIWTSQVRMAVENQLVNPAPFANCASPSTTSHLASINCFRTTGAKGRCVRIWLYFFDSYFARWSSHSWSMGRLWPNV